MLTAKQNLLETIHGGKPDRFVNQFEPFGLLWMCDPLSVLYPLPLPGQESKNAWGVSYLFKDGSPAAMPYHDKEHTVLHDVTRWREAVKAPSLDFPESAWQASDFYLQMVDRSDRLLTMAVQPGIFETMHFLMGMENCMTSLVTEPEAMHELIGFYVDWEIEYARLLLQRWQPEALFHHDDWGSAHSTLISVPMFAEFFLPAYKRLYGFYKENGIELIIHHSDSYAATLVPLMIEMGIDIYQGCMTTNNTPELIREYGGQISFMGDIDNRTVDIEDWTDELVAHEVERACRRCGKHYFIPDLIIGGPGSVYPGVYDAVSREIDRMSKEMF